MREKTRAFFNVSAKGKIIAHGHHYFQLSKHSKTTAFTSLVFSEGFFFASEQGKKNHLSTEQHEDRREEGRGGVGFHRRTRPLSLSRESTLGPDAAVMSEKGGGASVDWTRGAGGGDRKFLWEERKVSGLCVSLPLVLTLDLEDLVAQVGLDVVFAVGRQN